MKTSCIRTRFGQLTAALAIALFFVSAHAWADPDDVVDMESFRKELNPYSKGPYKAPSATLNYEKLKALISTHNIQSIDQLLAQIAKLDGVDLLEMDHQKADAYDGIFSNTAFVERTRSQQRASAKTPRVILRNSDATFFMAYSGDPKDPRYNTLEISQARGNQSQPIVIAFSDSGKSTPQFHDQTDGKSPQLKSCATCHTPEFRENIDGYSFWPGWIGEREEYTTPYDQKALDTLKAVHSDNPRYKYLIPFATSVLKDPGRKHTVTTALLYNRRFEWMVDKIRANPRYEQFKFAIVGALMNCSNVEKMIPDDWKTQRKSLAAVAEDTLRNIKRYNLIKERLAVQPATRDHELSAGTIYEPVVSKWRWVMEEFMGQSIQGWSLSRDHKGYDFSDAVGLGPFQLLAYLHQDAGVKKFPEGYLAYLNGEDDFADFTPTPAPGNAAVCADLETKSSAALSKTPLPAPIQATKAHAPKASTH